MPGAGRLTTRYQLSWLHRMACAGVSTRRCRCRRDGSGHSGRHPDRQDEQRPALPDIPPTGVHLTPGSKAVTLLAEADFLTEGADDTPTQTRHAAYLYREAYPLDALSALRQHARIRPALESLRACGREMGTRNPPPEPLDSAAIAEDVPCTGERGFRVGGVGNLPRGRMTVGAYARVCSTFTWGGKSRVSPRSTTRSPPW